MIRLRFMSVPVVLFLWGVLLFPFSASGEERWYYCSVDFAGPAALNTYVVLTDVASESAFAGKWFIAPKDREKEILAVALAAMSKNLQVALRADLSGGETPVIIALLLKR